MQTFKEITDRLKAIIGITRDKALAYELHIKPTTYASMKRRNKIPYAAILKYCHDHHIDANIVHWMNLKRKRQKALSLCDTILTLLPLPE